MKKTKKIRINESVFTGMERRYVDYQGLANQHNQPAINQQGLANQHNQSTTNRTVPVPSSGTTTPFHQNSLYTFVDHCANLRPWQQDFTNRLASTNNDFYMLAEPGGGKTAPVICHWVNNILGLNTGHGGQIPQQQFTNLVQLLTHPENVQQLLWLVPIQSLNSNIESEFIERMHAIILQFLNTFVTMESGNVIFNTPMEILITTMGNLCRNTQLATGLINMIQDPNQQAVNPTDPLTGQPLPGTPQPLPVHVQNPTYGTTNVPPLGNLTKTRRHVPSNYTETFRLQLGRLVDQYVRGCLVGIKQQGTNTWEILNTNYPKPIVICIYESAKDIIKNPNYNKLRLIVCDEAQRLQGSSEEGDIDRAKQIADSMHVVLTSNNSATAKLVMLTGTVHPNSAKNMMHFLNATYRRNFKADSLIISPDKNPSDIKVFPMTRLSNMYTQLDIIRSIISRNEKRVVFVIFSKKQIDELIDRLSTSETGNISSARSLSRSGTASLYGRRNIKEITSLDQNIHNISDPRLRRSLSNGIGFLYRQQNEMNDQQQRDSVIVQHLFTNGLIPILLCTDAIREGMNISVDTMYIPTIKKPSGKEMLPMEIGGLAQLLGRDGRRAGVTGRIYTSPEDVEPIMNALSGGFEKYDERSHEYAYNNERKFRSFINSADAAVRYWTGIMRGRG